jgi:hypothetical protein
MRALSAVSFAGAALAFFILLRARTSALGMILVEWETAVGVPPYVVLGGLGAALFFFGRAPRAAPLPSTPYRRTPDSSPPRPMPQDRAAETFDPDRDWFEQAKESAKAIRWPVGARLSIDVSKPCPIELQLEQVPPERAKRAISLLGSWIASMPTPPRARISYQHCPEGGSPRHHQAAGALAQSIHRGQFKTLSDLDAVDVMFHQPDPRWAMLR